jgi:hypothetical protein
VTAIEILQFSGVTGAVTAAAVMVLRYITLLIVVVWSLRANAAGRKHAVELLKLLYGGERHRSRPP